MSKNIIIIFVLLTVNKICCADINPAFIRPPRPNFDEPFDYNGWIESQLCGNKDTTLNEDFWGYPSKIAMPEPEPEIMGKLYILSQSYNWKPSENVAVEKYLRSIEGYLSILHQISTKEICIIAQKNELELAVLPNLSSSRVAFWASLAKSYRQDEDRKSSLPIVYETYFKHAIQLKNAGDLRGRIRGNQLLSDVSRAICLCIQDGSIDKSDYSFLYVLLQQDEKDKSPISKIIEMECAATLDCLQLLLKDGRVNKKMSDEMGIDYTKFKTVSYDLDFNVQAVYDYYETVFNICNQDSVLCILREMQKLEDSIRDENHEKPLCNQILTQMSKLQVSEMHAKVYYVGAFIVMKIYEFRDKNGIFPDSLDNIKDDKYETIDPFSGNSMIYKKTEYSFKLYSIGADGKDNGGVCENWGDLYYENKNKDIVIFPVLNK